MILILSYCIVIVVSNLAIVNGKKTKLIYEKLEAPDKDLKSFAGFYHEIFNEKGQDEVFDKFVEYLERVKD